MNISEHFTLEEFYISPTATRLDINNTPNQTAINNICALVEHVLEPARIKYGKPIMVNSGYRCEALNKAVGGAKNSQHIIGQACDITTGSHDGNKILFAILKHYFIDDIDQLIDEHGYSWIHVSYNMYDNGRHQVLHVG